MVEIRTQSAECRMQKGVFLRSAFCILFLYFCVLPSPALALRIISLLPSNTEILESLGAGSEVVGVTRYDRRLLREPSTASVGDFMHPDVERIVSLKPDLIVAG